VLRGGGLVREREVLMQRMAEVTARFEERDGEEKVEIVLDAWINGSLMRENHEQIQLLI